MTKRPLRSIQPAPMPARRMFTNEGAARKAAPKPGRDEMLIVDEVAAGRWSWAISVKPKTRTAAAAKPKTRKRAAKPRARKSVPAPAPKGGDA